MHRLFIALLLTISVICSAEDGKVFLKSDPVGAEVFLIGDDGKELKTLGKTAGIFKLPEGKSKLLLRLANFGDTFTEVEVKGTAILKPDTIKLAAITYSVDVVFAEEGWQILVDKVAQTENGKLTTTPATIKVSAGKHEIRLLKDGFKDITKTVEATKDQTVEIADKPQKGVSAVPAVAENKFKAEATKGWQQGPSFPIGTTISITATGKWGHDSLWSYGPEGLGHKVPISPKMVQGRKFECDDTEAGQGCLLVQSGTKLWAFKGTTLEIVTQVNGPIFFGILDSAVNDNHGSLDIVITPKKGAEK